MVVSSSVSYLSASLRTAGSDLTREHHSQPNLRGIILQTSPFVNREKLRWFIPFALSPSSSSRQATRSGVEGAETEFFNTLPGGAAVYLPERPWQKILTMGKWDAMVAPKFTPVLHYPDPHYQ